MKVDAVLGSMLVIVGIVVFLMGAMMPYRRDLPEFQRLYAQLGPGQSREFHALRAEFETPAKRLEDYGLTSALIAALVSTLRSLRSLMMKLPPSPWMAVLLGVVAVAATVAGETAQLFLDAWRGEFPWWADSLGIPLAGMPFVFVALCVWVLCNAWLTLWRPLATQKFRRVLRIAVLGAMGGVTLIALGAPVVGGAFLRIPVVVAWAAFYLAIVRCWDVAEPTTVGTVC